MLLSHIFFFINEAQQLQAAHFPSLAEKKVKKAGKDSRLSQKEAEILFTIPIFMIIIIMFTIVSKVVYSINPFLLSLPVAGLAGFIYLLASQYD